MPKQLVDGIKVIYVSRDGNILVRNFRYLKTAITAIRKNNYNLTFIRYFRGCSVLKIFFPDLKFIFDIRTGSVSKNKLFRLVYDFFMRQESRLFENVSVISKSLAIKFKLENKATILPVGSITLSSKIKNFNRFSLLYVGILTNREIDKTIQGFKRFYEEFHETLSISYTIIGGGYNNEEFLLKDIVKNLGLSEIVTITGRVPFDKLNPFFDSHNIGVSFVPMTPYFDFQPVTKTFDYLLSGMPVIATATFEHKRVITEENGVLNNDTAEDFYCALVELFNKKQYISSENIMRSSAQYNWKYIVSELGYYMQNVLGG